MAHVFTVHKLSFPTQFTLLKPEGWVVAALYCALKKDPESINFLDKALLLNENYVEALRVKGRLLMENDNFTGALNCFRQANQVERDLPSFVGEFITA